MPSIQDRFSAAALSLMRPASIKQRLLDAYLWQLAGIDVEELPRDVRAEFVALVERLHSGRAIGTMNAVEATVRKMSDREAFEYAQVIFGMCLAVHQPALAQRGPMLRAVGASDTE